jgi:outer membrane protein assembly factor BamA
VNYEAYVADGELHVRVREGRIVVISVVGSARLPPWLVQRWTGLYPGQILTERSLSLAREALLNTGHMSAVTVEPVWEEVGLVVRVSVEEAPGVGTLRGSLSFIPGAGFRVGLEGVQRNALGTAQDLVARVERAADGSSLSTLIFSGRGFPEYDLLEVGLVRVERGASLTAGVWAAASAAVGPGTSVRIAFIQDRAWPLAERPPLPDLRTAVRLEVTYLDLDSLSWPRTGQQMLLVVEKGGTFAPGVEYMAVEACLARYIPVTAAKARLTLATLLSIQVGWELPQRLRFVLGGLGNVRGASPVAVNALASAQFEVRIPWEPLGDLTLFWDVGIALDEPVSRTSVGMEVRVPIAGAVVDLGAAWAADQGWIPDVYLHASMRF